jgi:hypothetical protein
MRFHFPNLERPKKAAKRIADRLAGGFTLSKVQQGLSIVLGYRDWHELELAHAGAPPTPLDQTLDADAFHLRTADLVLKLAASLGISESEAQYVLIAARLAGDRIITLEDELAVRMTCWRAKAAWLDVGNAGAVVRLRFPASGPRRLGFLTADFDPGKSPVQIVSDNFFGICARNELAMPRQPLAPFMPLRLKLCYGAWTEADGSKVLFSRDYAPMWRLRDGCPPQQVSPFDWIRIEQEVWFWEDATAPWEDRRRIQEEEARLAAYGIPGLCGLADLLPSMVSSTGNVPSPAELLRRGRQSAAVAIAGDSRSEVMPAL